MTERILHKGEQAMKNMEAVAAMLTATSPNGATYEVEEVYLDFGQGWKWSTITRKGWHDCQVLSPRQWHMITDAATLAYLTMCIEDIKSGEYFADR